MKSKKKIFRIIALTLMLNFAFSSFSTAFAQSFNQQNVLYSSNINDNKKSIDGEEIHKEFKTNDGQVIIGVYSKDGKLKKVISSNNTVINYD